MSNKPLKEVWIVAVTACDSWALKGLYASKKDAIKRLFKERDLLIEDWRGMIEFLGKPPDKMFNEMIDAISKDDYENWDNDPHDTPILLKMRINYGTN